MALPKIYDYLEHQWHNNTRPAINEDNLNAMSKGLSDVDDRVISLAGTIQEDVVEIQEDMEILNAALETIDDSVASAQGSASTASAKAIIASNKALVAEGFAVGEQNGTEVGQDSDYYQNNAKYYAEIANPPIENTVDFTDIITISDAINKAAKDVRLKVEAVQDLHGYDNPWVDGAGKNKVNYDAWKTVSINHGTAVWENNGVTLTATSNDCFTQYTANIFPVDARVPISEGQTVTLSWKETQNIAGVVYIFPNGTTTGMVSIDNKNGKSLSYTATSGVTFITYRVSVSYQGETASFKDIQLEFGSTATAWEPYTNICPISGWDNAKVTRVAHQLWDEDWEVGSIGTDGSKVPTSAGRIRSKNLIPVKPNTSYYLSAKIAMYATYDIDGNFIRYAGYESGPTVLNASSNEYFIMIGSISGYGATYNNDLSVNYPSTYTAYEPYQGEELTISLNGTRYGCTLDVTSGVLTVDRVYGSGTVTGINDSYANITYGTFDKAADSAAKGNYNKFDIISSMFYSPTTEPSNWNDAAHVGGIFMTASTNLYWVGFPKGTTQAEMETTTADHKIVYMLATPTTVQLTPTQVYLLYGYNTLFGDCGDISLTYDASGIIHIEEAKLDTETLKTIAAASSDFADFKARIAAL